MKAENNVDVRPLIIVATISFLFTVCNKENDPVIAPITFNPSITYASMTDQDGNIYKTVTIGAQIWMAENLKTTKYNDGTDIPLLTTNSEWSKTTSGYCWYENNIVKYKSTYGALYKWYTINTGNLCPIGWHVPSDSEWLTLINFTGSELYAGRNLKEAGTTHWVCPEYGGDNLYGFTALPGGWRETGGSLDILELMAYFGQQVQKITMMHMTGSFIVATRFFSRLGS